MPYFPVFNGRPRRVSLWTALTAASLIAPTAVSAQATDAQARELDSLAAVVAALQQQIDAGAVAPPQAATRAPGAYMNVSFVGLTNAGWSTEPDVPSLQRGDHDPRVRGFTLPNAELVLDGAVDPYFRAVANLVYKLDPEGETGVELEEVYAVTTSLPANMQLKVGQSFLEFGRQNPQHPHSWAFADQPLVLNRMFGGEGLRSQGARLGWLTPLPWYTEAQLGVYNATGETTASFRSEESPELHGGLADESGVADGRDLLWVSRLATSLDLSDTQTLLAGASGAFGPNNSGPDTDTRILGVDGYWKWRPTGAERGFPFLSLQGEYLWRRYEAGTRILAEDESTLLAAETLRDRGYYGQVLWGIRPLLVAGLRGESASGDPGAFDSELRADRWRISPDLTWYPTEFSKVRVQYNYDDREGLGVDHSLWLQLEFLLGAHAAHQF